MKSRRLMLAPLAVLALATAASLQSLAANYNEASMPDLSNNPSAPTAFALSPGANTLTGTAGLSDFDLITFTIPTGGSLTSLILSSYVNPFNSVSFVGIGNGATWLAGLDFNVDPTYVAGWAHIFTQGPTGIGNDLLIPMSTAVPATGFQRPLAAGAYSMLIQDTDNTVSYSMTFNVVPEPAAGAWLRRAHRGSYGAGGASKRCVNGMSTRLMTRIVRRRAGSRSAALLVRNHDAKRTLAVRQRLAIAAIRDEDHFVSRRWVDFEQRKRHAIVVGRLAQDDRRRPPPFQLFAEFDAEVLQHVVERRRLRTRLNCVAVAHVDLALRQLRQHGFVQRVLLALLVDDRHGEVRRADDG